MQFCELKRIKEAPASGMMLAYTRRAVLFQAYRGLKEVESLLAGQQLLELHLFHDHMEYRSISTRSPRYENGVIEAVIDFPEDDRETVFQEEILLESAVGGGNIIMLHHLSYSEEDGMMMIDDYRLKMGGMS